MRIAGLQKLTLLDYPGKTACIIFTRGCQFRCPFCHNAELAEDTSGDHVTEAEVFAHLNKRKGVLDGVVITGGEPCLQKDLASFIRRVKELGYAVKLDTNGAMPRVLSSLLEEGLPDYVAMDIKNSPRLYAQTAGCPVDLAVLQESIALLERSGVEHEFRTTVVKGLHDGESLREAAELIAGTKRYFLQGYADSGHVLAPAGLSAFSREEMEALAGQVRPLVPGVALRGV